MIPFDEDLRTLIEYVRSLGATDEEIDSAWRMGGLGPLALDLAMRPPGTAVSLDDFVAAEPDPDLARRLWLALGLPSESELPFPVTSDAAEAIRVLALLAPLLGEEAVLGFARVVGSSTARVADSLASATRVGMEVPQLATGRPYSEVARENATAARELLPVLWEAIGAVFRRHLVLVSHQRWAPDADRVAVVVQRTVGFVDLVGSTEVLRELSVAELARLVDRFEQLVWDKVTAVGGRVVKLIGDEAMFVLETPHAAARVAVDLIEASPEPVRIGFAHGEVAALHGDYYGRAVNLAARLVAVAPAGAALSSTEIAGFDCTPFDTGPLRGFPATEIGAFRVA